MLYRPTYLATILNADGEVRAKVSFPSDKAAKAYVHDALRFERFGRGHTGTITFVNSSPIRIDKKKP